MHRFYILLVLVIIILTTSCKKFLDVGDPPDKVVADYVYNHNSSAASVLTGIYFTLQQRLQGGVYAISTFYGLSADECSTLAGSSCYAIYTNNTNSDYWIFFYETIYKVNAAIEGLNTSTALNSTIKQHLLGEAKFIRAFIYFYLVNIYGDVPLITASDYKLNMVAGRAAQADVFKMIISDLNEAKESLSSEYLDSDALSASVDRVRPNKWTAIALLARVFLYMKEWGKAEEAASLIIDNKALFDTVSLNNVFLKNSKEAIWQLLPVDPGGVYKNTLDAPVYILTNGPDYFDHPVWVSDFLYSAFESGDLRKSCWIGTDTSTGNKYNYFYKYKLYRPEDESDEYFMVFRLGEQYLIRAEARAEKGNLTESLADLNIIRNRAGLADVAAIDKEMLLSSILHERQVELFMEWGHRWFDLKRTGRLDYIMMDIATQKGAEWESYKKLDGIPFNDLLLNPNLKQNEGYPSP